MTDDEIIRELTKIHDDIENVRKMLADENVSEPGTKTAQRRQPESGMEQIDMKEVARLVGRDTRKTVRRLIEASHDTASAAAESIQPKRNIPRLNTSARTHMEDNYCLLQIEVKILH